MLYFASYKPVRVPSKALSSMEECAGVEFPYLNSQSAQLTWTFCNIPSGNLNNRIIEVEEPILTYLQPVTVNDRQLVRQLDPVSSNAILKMFCYKISCL